MDAALRYLKASLSYGSLLRLSASSKTNTALGPGDLVFVAEELKYASQELGKVTGDVGIEDILDVLFSKFCIGK